MITYGHIPDQPDYVDDNLFETAGYVVEINVEQEGPRQALHFLLRIYWGFGHVRTRDQKCKIYLDVNTTTAMAQLQLLRDALWSGRLGNPYLVHIWFNFASESSDEWIYVYFLTVILRDTERVTVSEFRGVEINPVSWYYHES